ncbi:MAG: hypothetical protein ACLP01_25395 [Solirubrobacteraceae bacterium]
MLRANDLVMRTDEIGATLQRVMRIERIVDDAGGRAATGLCDGDGVRPGHADGAGAG